MSRRMDILTKNEHRTRSLPGDDSSKLHTQSMVHLISSQGAYGSKTCLKLTYRPLRHGQHIDTHIFWVSAVAGTYLYARIHGLLIVVAKNRYNVTTPRPLTHVSGRDVIQRAGSESLRPKHCCVSLPHFLPCPSSEACLVLSRVLYSLLQNPRPSLQENAAAAEDEESDPLRWLERRNPHV